MHWRYDASNYFLTDPSLLYRSVRENLIEVVHSYTGKKRNWKRKLTIICYLWLHLYNLEPIKEKRNLQSGLWSQLWIMHYPSDVHYQCSFFRRWVIELHKMVHFSVMVSGYQCLLYRKSLSKLGSQLGECQRFETLKILKRTKHHICIYRMYFVRFIIFDILNIRHSPHTVMPDWGTNPAEGLFFARFEYTRDSPTRRQSGITDPIQLALIVN